MYGRIRSVLNVLLGHTIGAIQWAVGHIRLGMRKGILGNVEIKMLLTYKW